MLYTQLALCNSQTLNHWTQLALCLVVKADDLFDDNL